MQKNGKRQSKQSKHEQLTLINTQIRHLTTTIVPCQIPLCPLL